jgi:hypothetical protein
MRTVIRLEEDQVDEVVLIEKDQNYAANSKPGKAGKTFASFRYDGILFTVKSSDPFIEDQVNGTVNSIKLIKSVRDKEVTVKDNDGNDVKTIVPVDALEFDSYQSFTKQLNRAKHNSAIAQYKVLSSQPVSEDTLTALQNG